MTRSAAVTARVLWPPRRRVYVTLLLAAASFAVWTWQVRSDVRQAEQKLDMVENAVAGTGFDRLAAEAPGLVSLAARSAAGAGRWHDVAALFPRYADRLPPALLRAAELELGLRSRAVPPALATDDSPVSAFELRLSRALAVDASGVQQLLFDRRGRPLGAINADKSLVLEPDLPEGLMPPQLATRLLPPALEPPGLAAAGPAAMAATSADARALRLTIDRAWSVAAERALGREEGAIVILELPTAAVLAAVSKRSPSRLLQSGGDSVLDPREPASIAKLITTTAVMRAGLDPDGMIADMRCRGSVLIGGERLYCSAVKGRLQGLNEAMATSCNVAFAELAMAVGDRALVEEYERYGFLIGSPGSGGLPGSSHVPGVVHEYRHSGKRLGDLSIGLDEASITPLGAALFAAILSDGVKREPRFVLQADGLLGISPRKQATGAGERGEPVLDPAWLPALHESMRAVVAPGGTANRVAPRRLRVAMKTGTARDPGKPFHVNYVGFLPSGGEAPPRYAFAVRVTGQTTSARVRRSGYAVTHRLLRELDGFVGHQIEAATGGRR